MMLGKNGAASLVAEMIPRGSVGVELGVWRGDTSLLFLEKASFLYLVDSWSFYPYKVLDHDSYREYQAKYKELVLSEDEGDFMKYYDKVYNEVLDKTRGKPVKIYRQTTRDFFKHFSEKVDWVYVDAMHEYLDCFLDLQDSYNIVKSGGAIYVDDYNLDQVKEAVEFFCALNDLNPLPIKKTQCYIEIP